MTTNALIDVTHDGNWVISFCSDLTGDCWIWLDDCLLIQHFISYYISYVYPCSFHDPYFKSLSAVVCLRVMFHAPVTETVTEGWRKSKSWKTRVIASDTAKCLTGSGVQYLDMTDLTCCWLSDCSLLQCVTFWIFIDPSGVRTSRFRCYMAGTNWNCCRLGVRSVYTMHRSYIWHEFTVSLHAKPHM